jgi:hypothetical protein
MDVTTGGQSATESDSTRFPSPRAPQATTSSQGLSHGTERSVALPPPPATSSSLSVWSTATVTPLKDRSTCRTASWPKDEGDYSSRAVRADAEGGRTPSGPFLMAAGTEEDPCSMVSAAPQAHRLLSVDQLQRLRYASHIPKDGRSSLACPSHHDPSTANSAPHRLLSKEEMQHPRAQHRSSANTYVAGSSTRAFAFDGAGRVHSYPALRNDAHAHFSHAFQNSRSAFEAPPSYTARPPYFPHRVDPATVFPTAPPGEQALGMAFTTSAAAHPSPPILSFHEADETVTSHSAHARRAPIPVPLARQAPQRAVGSNPISPSPRSPQWSPFGVQGVFTVSSSANPTPVCLSPAGGLLTTPSTSSTAPLSFGNSIVPPEWWQQYGPWYTTYAQQQQTHSLNAMESGAEPSLVSHEHRTSITSFAEFGARERDTRDQSSAMENQTFRQRNNTAAFLTSNRQAPSRSYHRVERRSNEKKYSQTDPFSMYRHNMRLMGSCNTSSSFHS